MRKARDYAEFFFFSNPFFHACMLFLENNFDTERALLCRAGRIHRETMFFSEPFQIRREEAAQYIACQLSGAS